MPSGCSTVPPRSQQASRRAVVRSESEICLVPRSNRSRARIRTERVSARSPGPCSLLSVTLSTGIGRPSIQHQLDWSAGDLWVTGARHDALALEEIARTVAYRQIGITVREHAGVFALAGVVARADQAPPASEFVRELAAYG